MKNLVLFIILAFIAGITNAQWQLAGCPFNGKINCFAVGDSGIFAGTNGGGVYLSTDNGSSWSAVNSGLANIYVNALTISGINIFAGTQAGVYLSANNGNIWNKVNSGLTDTFIYSLAVDGENIFAGTKGGGIFLSATNGSSWAPDNNGLAEYYVNSFAIDGANIFTGTDWGVFLSGDNGENWAPLSKMANNEGQKSNTNVWAIAIKGTYVFTATDWGVYLSRDNGNSWISADTGLTDTYTRTFAINGKDIFTGTFGDGVFISTNNGYSWTGVNNGLANTYVNCLIISGANIFAGTLGGIWKRPLNEITGINEKNNGYGNFILYPNPAHNYIIVTNPYSKNNNKEMISVYNIQGKLLLQASQKQEKTEIDISVFLKGIYLIKISNNEMTFFQRIIKE